MSRESELRELLSEMSGKDVSAIDIDADLVRELCLDSLAGLRMLARVEERFDARFPDERLSEFRTIRQLLEVIER
jgi:acyl carrier protein